MDLNAGTTMALLENIEHLGGHIWAPDASFIIYSINEKQFPETTKVKFEVTAPVFDDLLKNFEFLSNEGTAFFLNVCNIVQE